MSVSIDTYNSLIKVFIMPTIEKIFNNHSRVINGFGGCVHERIGEVVLSLDDIPSYMNSYYGSCLIEYSKRNIIYNEIIDALVKMGFNRKNLSFNYDTIRFRNFEFHKKLLNKNNNTL